VQKREEVLDEVIEFTVVPKARMQEKQVHDKSGQLGLMKVIIIIKRDFVWPL